MTTLPRCCQFHAAELPNGCDGGRKCPDRLGLCTNLRHIDDFRPPAGYQPLEPNEAQEKADQPVTNEVFKSGLLWLGVLLVFVVLGSLWATPWPRLVAIVSGVWK
jgi:hypothetical protein